MKSVAEIRRELLDANERLILDLESEYTETLVTFDPPEDGDYETETVIRDLTKQNAGDSCPLVEIAGRNIFPPNNLIRRLRSYHVEGTKLNLQMEKMDGTIHDLAKFDPERKRSFITDPDIDCERFADQLLAFYRTLRKFAHRYSCHLAPDKSVIYYKKVSKTEVVLKFDGFMSNFNLDPYNKESTEPFMCGDFDFAPSEWMKNWGVIFYYPPRERKHNIFHVDQFNRLSETEMPGKAKYKEFYTNNLKKDVLTSYVKDYPELNRIYNRFKNNYDEDLLLFYLGSFGNWNVRLPFYPETEGGVTELINIAKTLPFPFGIL